MLSVTKVMYDRLYSAPLKPRKLRNPTELETPAAAMKEVYLHEVYTVHAYASSIETCTFV